MTRRLLAEPLVHFALAGLVLFGISRVVSDGVEERVVEVSTLRAERLFAAFEEQQGRPPNAEEASRILSVAVDSEILRREARRLGFDRTDPVVQRRLTQKMRFALEGQAELEEPEEEELQAYLEAHVDRYRRPATVSFEHVFVARGSDGLVGFDELGRRLRAGDDPKTLGEPFNPGRRFEARGHEELARQFGRAFADALLELELGAWAAVESSLGSHWVRVEERSAARPARLDEVRARVLESWREERRAELLKRELEALRSDYEVRLPSTSERGGAG